MSGKWVWTEDGHRPPRSKRRSKKGIRTTKRADPLVRRLRSGWKGFIRTVKFLLMAAGTLALLLLVLNWLGGG